MEADYSSGIYLPRYLVTECHAVGDHNSSCTHNFEASNKEVNLQSYWQLLDCFLEINFPVIDACMRCVAGGRFSLLHSCYLVCTEYVDLILHFVLCV